jgi:hypothetical protein
MTREQDAVIRRLRRLVRDAGKAGVALVADATNSNGTIRVMTAEEATRDDIRGLGEAVSLHGGCGGGVLPRTDPNGNG